MADNSVFITGIAENTFADEIRKLPAWATEATMQDVKKFLRLSVDELKKISNNGSTGTGGGSTVGSTSAQNVSDELDRLAKSLKRKNEEDALAEKRAKAKAAEDEQGLAGGKKLRTNSQKLDYVLGGLAVAGTKILANDKKYLDVYDSLYRSGINVLNGNNSTKDGFEALNQMVNLTGMRLETMQKILEKYSATVNVVGVSKFTKAIYLSTTKLNELGYYNENLGDLIGTLIESEKGYMDVRGKSSEQIANDAIRLGTQLDKLSKTAGMSREQLQENLKANAKSTDALLVTARFGTDAARNLSLATAGIKDNELRQTIMELAASTNDMQVEGFRKLQAAGLGDIGNQLSQFSKSLIGLDPSEAQQRMRVFAEQIASQTGRISALSNIYDKGGKAAAGVVNSMLFMGRDVSDATDVQTDNAKKTQASLSGFNQQVERTSAIMQAAFFPMVTTVNTATEYLKLFNDAVYAGIGAVEANTRSQIGALLAIGGLVAGFILARGKIGTFASVFSSSSTVVGSSAKTLASTLGSLALKFVAAAGAFALGYEVGTAIYDNWLSKSETFQKGSTATFKGVDGILSFFGSDEAKKRLKVQEDADKFASGLSPNNKFKKAEISVPKNPVPSIINSPSATSTNTAGDNDSTSPLAPEAKLASGTGIERPSNNNDINSLLGYQASIMEQVLHSTTSLLRVNEDILRYTKTRA